MHRCDRRPLVPQILTDTSQAKQSLKDIEARHQDIMKLENSIRELHDMFMDMAMLVESQVRSTSRLLLIVSHFSFCYEVLIVWWVSNSTFIRLLTCCMPLYGNCLQVDNHNFVILYCP